LKTIGKLYILVDTVSQLAMRAQRLFIFDRFRLVCINRSGELTDHYGIYTQRTWVTIDLREANNPLLISSSINDNAYKFFTLVGKYVSTL